MVSVLWRGISVPLIWTLLPKAGNSNTAERVDLLDRLERIFPQMRIGSLTGDREFIGNAWMTYLAQRARYWTLFHKPSFFNGLIGNVGEMSVSRNLFA
jgi:hypothetical protein